MADEHNRDDANSVFLTTIGIAVTFLEVLVVWETEGVCVWATCWKTDAGCDSEVHASLALEER